MTWHLEIRHLHAFNAGPHAIYGVQEDLSLRLGPLALKMGGAQGRRAQAALRVPAWAVRAVLFQAQRVVLRNSLLKLLGVFLASVPVILFGAVFYEFASGGSLWDGVVHIYGALYKIPGPLPNAPVLPTIAIPAAAAPMSCHGDYVHNHLCCHKGLHQEALLAIRLARLPTYCILCIVPGSLPHFLPVQAETKLCLMSEACSLSLLGHVHPELECLYATSGALVALLAHILACAPANLGKSLTVCK